MEKLKEIPDKIYKYRYIIAIVILIICVIFKLNGSSVGLWEPFVNNTGADGYNVGVLLGNSRYIRSDEWNVNTSILLSQYHNNFGYTNSFLRGTESDVFIYEQPVKDISMIFRIFQVAYLFLSPEHGMSIFWYGRLIALFLATFEFAMIITNKNKKLSTIASVLVTFSSTVQWWFATNTLVEMLVFAEVALVLLDKYMIEKSTVKKAIYSGLYLYVLVVFVCVFIHLGLYHVYTYFYHF